MNEYQRLQDNSQHCVNLSEEIRKICRKNPEIYRVGPTPEPRETRGVFVRIESFTFYPNSGLVYLTGKLREAYIDSERTFKEASFVQLKFGNKTPNFCALKLTNSRSLRCSVQSQLETSQHKGNSIFRFLVEDILEYEDRNGQTNQQ